MKMLLPLLCATATLLPSVARAIPAFARRYNLPCSQCHDPIPKLTAFGEVFAARGFQLAEGDTTGATTLGDPLLMLQQQLPLALRFDAYVRAQRGASVRTDFQTPVAMKLLSGGPVARNVTYYVYLLLAEDGETGPIEDAWVMFRNPVGLPADVSVGQFQIADPLWKRELRITLENYAVLSQRLGAGAANLSYDRGVLVSAEPVGGGAASVMVVNGNGIGPAEGGDFDGDSPKAVAVTYAQAFGPLRLGILAYRGTQRMIPSGAASARANRTTMFGPAVSFSGGPVELNAQWLWRRDTNPRFLLAGGTVETSGGFVEAHWRPGGRGGRSLVTALYNGIASDLAGADYETMTLNLSWLYARNLRLAGEFTWDLLSEEPRFALGVVTAF